MYYSHQEFTKPLIYGWTAEEAGGKAYYIELWAATSRTKKLKVIHRL